MSLNGCLDAGTGTRTIFSDEEDTNAVDLLRANCDAILIGGNTARYDNPSLLVKRPENIQYRTTKGHSPQPIRIILWGKEPLSKHTKLKTLQDKCSKTIILKHSSVIIQQHDFPQEVTFISYDKEKLDLHELLYIIKEQGISKLLVEGGNAVLNLFIQENFFNEIRLAYSGKILSSDRAIKFKTAKDHVFERVSLKTANTTSMNIITYKQLAE